MHTSLTGRYAMTRKKAVAVVVFIISVIFCIIVFLIVFTENANKNVYKSELEEKTLLCKC